MTVTMTAEAAGKKVGETYTGPEEESLLARGEAKRDGYTGPGVSDTGPMAETPAEDPTNAANREDPEYPATVEAQALEDFDGFANDATNLAKTKFPATYDFDKGGVDDDAGA